MPDYVILSAARNEEAYIEKTIRAVLAQTRKPLKWIIISDGSTDRTNPIVQHYAETNRYIQLVTSTPDGSRNFGSKARAINLGHTLVRDLDHDFVAILDADVSFDPFYYEKVMQRFAEDPRLGLAGGILYDNCNGEFIRQKTSADWSVSGPIQMFRRRCFDEMGGYQALPYGGIDAVAESAARMLGWKVRAFPDIKVNHHRRTGAEKGNMLVTSFRDGVKEYGYGCDPAFVAAKAFYRLLDAPVMIGSALRLAGYCTAWIRRYPRALPAPVLDAIRREQRLRLACLLRKPGAKGRQVA
jgi:biofilm PGA synthesis N-glycosyltransferase PgaC